MEARFPLVPGDGEQKEEDGQTLRANPVTITAVMAWMNGSAIDLKASSALLREMPVHRLFDAMATRIDPEKAGDDELTINFVFTDVGQSFVLTVRNAVLAHAFLQLPTQFLQT